MSGYSSGQRLSRVARLALLALFGVLALAGCATRDEASTATSTPDTPDAFPIQLTWPSGKPFVISHAPKRIVSLSPAGTEILYAIGAGSEVKAVDDQSDYPPEAPKTALSGFTPNVEAIAALDPDLVVLYFDSNGVSSSLEQLNIPVLLLPSANTLDDAYNQWTLLGKVTGHRQEAETLVTNAKNEIQRIVAETPKPNRQLTYFHELDQTLYTATSKTFIGQVYSLFGLVNVADPVDSPDDGGYPQMGEQALFQANPDLIFLADTKCCGQSAQTVQARPHWNTLNAVKSGNVVALDDDIASRSGPRIVDLVRTVAHAVTRAGKAG